MSLLDHISENTALCLARYEALARSPATVLAVSGGIDSTALSLVMANIFAQGKLPGGLVIGHVDHGVRPDSAAGAEAVEALSEQLGLPVALRRLSLSADPSEEEMRDARYEALEDIASEYQAGTILTAHHADDDLETILFRMMRGTGVRGLGGIPEYRMSARGTALLRPFLRTRRRTLERLLGQHGLKAVEDSSNLDTSKSRNFLRHELIPDLRRSLGSQLDASLFALSRTARAVTGICEAQANRILSARSVQIDDWRTDLDLRGLEAADEPFIEQVLRTIHERLCGQSPATSWLERAIKLCGQATGQRLEASSPLLCERNRKGLILLNREHQGSSPDQASELNFDDIPTRFGTTEWHIRVQDRLEPPLSPSPAEAGPERALIDLATAPGPWFLRSRRPGDRFWPLGQCGDVDLRRFLQSRHVARFDRDRLPLVVDQRDRILWIPGVEVADFARIQVGTGSCALLRVIRGCGAVSLPQSDGEA